MKKLFILTLSLALAICFIPSCSEGQSASSVPTTSSSEDESIEAEYATDTEDEFSDEINTVGNTASNLANGGYYARQGTKLYYRNEDMSCQLTCMGTDCTSPEIITTEVTMVNNINVVGDNIYFSSENGGIYTVKTDKSGFTKILDGTCIYLVATADKLIYALDDAGVIYLYSSNTDGSEQVLLKYSAGLTGDFAFENGRIYYSFNEAENVKDYVCYVSVDGTETGSAYANYCDSFIVLNSKIYAYSAGTLNVISLSDSANSLTVSEVNIDYMNTDGTNVYFTDADSGNMYKISLSDSSVTQLNKYACSNISLFANHIYYNQPSTVNPSGYCHWRMRTDGTFDAKRVFAIF